MLGARVGVYEITGARTTDFGEERGTYDRVANLVTE
jgi:hypothetical protein